jgi:hypothetical protein
VIVCVDCTNKILADQPIRIKKLCFPEVCERCGGRLDFEPALEIEILTSDYALTDPRDRVAENTITINIDSTDPHDSAVYSSITLHDDFKIDFKIE